MKLNFDHSYLEELYEKILIILSNKLNKEHSINNTIDFWRILIGPWLITYISVIFDRYEQLKNVNQNELSTAIITQQYIHSENYDDFITNILTDNWNFQIYFKLIRELFPEIKIIDTGITLFNNKKLNEYRIQTFNFKNFVFKILDTFNFRSKYFFHTPYIKLNKYIKLSFILMQFPSLNESIFNYTNKAKINYSLRNQNLNLQYKNNFEFLIDKFLFQDIPKSYLENFLNIKNYTNKIKLSPKVILTANSYWSNDIFKHWLAQKKVERTKIVILEHGGCFPMKYNSFFHEEKISDFFVTWHIPYSKFKQKQIQLSPNKLGKVKNLNISGKYCSYLGFESPKYGYKLTAQPMSIQVLYHFNDSILFYKNLIPLIRNNFVVRPYANMGWETEDRYKDLIGIDKIKTSKDCNYNKFIKDSRIIICSYPQTTFVEAMITGKPTILFYNPNFNEYIIEDNTLITKLIEANIIFHSPIKAAEHINKNWDNLNDWWFSKEVKDVRQLFFTTIINKNSNFYKDWIFFLKQF